jgi:hypothetical protein
MSLKNFDVNNVKAGREYIEAYVQFFKFAEGEEEHNREHAVAASPIWSYTEKLNFIWYKLFNRQIEKEWKSILSKSLALIR